MATDGSVPTFGFWYDFRRKPPLGDYESCYTAECFEEAEDAERLGYAGVWPSEYDFCFWYRLPDISHEQALANIRLFASEVAPGVGDDAVKA